MEKKAVVQQVKALIKVAETGKALQVLTEYLDKEGPKALDPYNDAIQLSAQFQKTQKEEQLSTISVADAKVSYNQINSAILLLVSQLEAPPLPAKKVKQRNGLIIGLLSVAIAAAAFFFLRPQKATSECPQYTPDTDFDILILPFQDVIPGQQVAEAHKLLQTGLIRLIEKYNLENKANVGAYATEFAKSENYPTGNRAAADISKNCDAQMVIWGTIEKIENAATNTNFSILTTNYNFLNETTVKVNKHEIGINTELGSSDMSMAFPSFGIQKDTLTSFSSIPDKIPPPIEARLKFLLGVFAHESGNNEVTQDILKEWPEEPLDQATTQAWGALLADSYLKTDNMDKAEATYSRILRDDPDNQLALNNRALIYYEKGKYAAALRDLNTNLEKNENDTTALTARSYIYMRLDKLEKAEVDLNRARNLDPDRPILKEWSEKLDEKKADETRVIKKADETLKVRKDDINSLVAKAKAERNLGNYDKAKVIAEKVISIDPKNAVAHAIIIEAIQTKNPEASLQTVVQRALKNGISIDTLIAKSRILENIIKKE
ncbi:MAG: tetratricopeptide repeat protein [Saprospiraceae bacterium]